MTPSLRMRGISHSFRGGAPLFLGLDAEIEAGEIIGLVGRSGAGKSTLLSIIAGWLEPMTGSVQRHGITTTAWVFQNPHGVARRTAIDHVVLPLLAQGARRAEAEREARRVADRFELAHALDRPFRDLSGGEAQRLMLARAAARRPDLLLVDEPTAQLDAASATAVSRVLREIADARTIVIVATHDPETRDACTRVVDLSRYSPSAVGT